jgi:hypothetical protein
MFMDDLNLKVFFTATNMYCVGNQLPDDGDDYVFDFLCFISVKQDQGVQLIPFGLNMAKDTVKVKKSTVTMMADAVEALKADYQRSIGEIKAARAGIQIVPAGALDGLNLAEGKRPNVQKLI